MKIIINERLDKPIYTQIVEQISQQILSGEIPPHYCLPSIRKIALELRISVITVKKAYEELEHQGLIYTVAGKGCFVQPLLINDVKEKKDDILEKYLADDIRFIKDLGITLEELIEFIKKRY